MENMHTDVSVWRVKEWGIYNYHKMYSCSNFYIINQYDLNTEQ